MTEPHQPSTPGPQKILVVRVGALGDTLMATPLVRKLHEHHPAAEIDFLCSSLAAPLLELNPHLKLVLPLRGRNLPLTISLEKRRLVHQIRARNYELAVLLESAPRYREILDRAGLSPIRSFNDVPFDPSKHSIVNNLRVGGISEYDGRDLDMDLPLSQGDGNAAVRILQGLPRPLIGVHVGWGPRGRKRRQAQRQRGWNLENFVQLIRRIAGDRTAGFVLTGSGDDRKQTRIICDRFPCGNVRSVAGQTSVRELAAVLRNLDLLISVDSAPCHMAAALGTPLVVLWGPGRLDQTRPLSSSTPIRIVRHAVPCAPCQSTPLQKSCRRNICMEQITPEEVIREAQSLLPSLA
jgi:ADP-heptose:LPS heptosyltransferase